MQGKWVAYAPCEENKHYLGHMRSQWFHPAVNCMWGL